MNKISYKFNCLIRLNIDKIMLLIIFILTGYSIIVLWSATGQNVELMKNKLLQIFFGFLVMIIMTKIPPKIYEHYSLYLYILSLILLISVNFFGETSKGAKRWLDFAFIRFQPSEIAKITVPLIVARFINRSFFPLTAKKTIFIIILILIPTFLVAKQPDLGTSVLIAFSGLLILFLGGANWKIILILLAILSFFLPILWFFLMHDYQKNRIITLLNPTNDPLGAGYHIIQSKIAIGSGGLFGKGWLKGTQSQLEFLPERHTDFIFSVLAEEFGLIGITILIILYLILIIRGLNIACKVQNTFSRIISAGFALILFFYVFINIGMVIGILPIVGIPLPIISYGGSSFIILMAKFGIIMSIKKHKTLLSKNLLF